METSDNKDKQDIRENSQINKNEETDETASQPHLTDNANTSEADCEEYTVEQESSKTNGELAYNDINDTEKEAFPTKSVSDSTTVKIYKFAPIPLAFIVAILGALTAFKSYEAGTRYFTSSTVSTLFSVFMALSMLFAFSAVFVLPRSFFVSSFEENKLLRLLNLLSAASAIACVPAFKDNVMFGKFATAITVFAIISALYSLLCALGAPATAKLLAGIGHILFCSIIIFTLYIEPAVEINSPFKLFIQFGAAAVLLSTIANTRVIFMRAGAKMFYFFKNVALILCLSGGAVVVCAFIRGATAFDRSYLFFAIFYLTEAIVTAISLINAKTESRQ